MTYVLTLTFSNKKLAFPMRNIVSEIRLKAYFLNNP